MSEKVLKLRVLDKLAKEIVFDKWKEIQEFGQPTFRRSQIELVVDLALEEVRKEIDKVHTEWNTGSFSWSTVLKHRLSLAAKNQKGEKPLNDA